MTDTPVVERLVGLRAGLDRRADERFDEWQQEYRRARREAASKPVRRCKECGGRLTGANRGYCVDACRKRADNRRARKQRAVAKAAGKG